MGVQAAGVGQVGGQYEIGFDQGKHQRRDDHQRHVPDKLAHKTVEEEKGQEGDDGGHYRGGDGLHHR